VQRHRLIILQHLTALMILRSQN